MSGGFRGRSRSGIAIAATGALIILLGVLATLQYRWIGEVSSAERDRMRANTRASAENIAYEFDGEIARVYHHFAVPAGTNDPGGYIAASARAWSASVRSPEIVREVYLARRDAPKEKTDKTDRLVLARVDLATGQTSAEEWPAALELVRDHIEQFSVPPARLRRFRRRGFFGLRALPRIARRRAALFAGPAPKSSTRFRRS